MSFYVVFAAILLASRKALLPMLAIWALVELVLALLFYNAANVYLAFLGSPMPLEFICGALIGYAFRKKAIPSPTFVLIVGLAIAAMLWTTSVTVGLPVLLMKNDIMRVIQFGLPAALIVYGAVGRELERGSKIPNWIVRLGDASYSTYLWHMPIIIVIGLIATRVKLHGVLADTLAQIITILGILAFSMLAYRFFERPVTSWLNRRIDLFLDTPGLARTPSRLEPTSVPAE